MQYALKVAYLGTDFSGWQRQRNAPSVQAELERALAAHLGREVALVGAGRTDRGVHAEGQVAAFRFGGELAPGGLVHGVNALLPGSIRVLGAAPAPPGFHPRRSAEAKTYLYRFTTRKPVPPALAATRLGVDPALDFEGMARAALVTIGEHDFAAFASSGHAPGGTKRKVFAARLERRSEEEWEFRITGSGFLRGMVRALVGTLLEVGRGRRSIGELEALLAPASSRTEAGPTAPAHGLTLLAVHYPPASAPVW